MNLTVQYDCRTATDGTRCAIGVVIIDTTAARSVHEAGYLIHETDDDQSATLAGLVRTLDCCAALNPQRLDVRCRDEHLVEQLTAGADVPASASLWFEQAMRLLLQLDAWQMTRDDEDQLAKATSLADQALTVGEDVVALDLAQSPKQHKKQYTGVPQWTAELLENPGPDCPARCPHGRKYPFGPDIPPGLCVHAAHAVLNDGPLHWDDDGQRSMTTLCPNCEVPIRIELVE